MGGQRMLAPGQEWDKEFQNWTLNAFQTDMPGPHPEKITCGIPTKMLISKKQI
jgi:hypothetical protein